MCWLVTLSILLMLSRRQKHLICSIFFELLPGTPSKRIDSISESKERNFNFNDILVDLHHTFSSFQNWLQVISCLRLKSLYEDAILAPRYLKSPQCEDPAILLVDY